MIFAIFHGRNIRILFDFLHEIEIADLLLCSNADERAFSSVKLLDASGVAARLGARIVNRCLPLRSDDRDGRHVTKFWRTAAVEGKPSDVHKAGTHASSGHASRVFVFGTLKSGYPLHDQGSHPRSL
jgi:hypothetical protein